MLSQVTAGKLTIRGLSLGGVYTSIAVPELDLLFDVGIAARSSSGIGTLVLSHGHADHVGALNALLGLRGLHGQKKPLRVVLPAEIENDLRVALEAMTRLQRWPLDIVTVPMQAGDVVALRGDLELRAIKTFHPVPSLGYIVSRRIQKLRAEFRGMPGPAIAERRRLGDEMLETVVRPELAYVTDTLVSVLDHSPELYDVPTLILEATFLDDRKTIDTARAGCHIHLDELIERAANFNNDHVVLMHFSQLYAPGEIAPLLQRRLPENLARRVVPLVPTTRDWPG